MRAVLVLLLAAGILIGLHFIARAQTPVSCDDYDRIVNHLEQHYGERTVVLGALPNGRLMQILVSNNGTFTVLIVGPDKVACLVISGDGWQVVKQGRGS